MLHKLIDLIFRRATSTTEASPRRSVYLHGSWTAGRQTEKAFHATCSETGSERWFPKSQASLEAGRILLPAWLAAKVYEEFFLKLAAKAHEAYFAAAVKKAHGDEDTDDQERIFQEDDYG